MEEMAAVGVDDLRGVSELIHDLRRPVDFDYWSGRLVSDGRFLAEMRLCRNWAIPHSQFLGWHPLDQEKALAFEAWEGRRCPECGVHPDNWPTEDAEPYEVTADRCFGCVALGDWQDAFQETNTSPNGTVDRRAMRGVRTRFAPPEREV